MKKLLLSLLLVYPAFGFAVGGNEKLYEVGSKIRLTNGEYCIVTEIKDDFATVRSRNWVIPGVAYREYKLQPFVTTDGYEALVTAPLSSTLRFSKAAKVVGIGAAIAAVHIGATKYFGTNYTDYTSQATKFLSTQKDNFVNALSAVFGHVSNVVSPLLQGASKTVAPVIEKVGETVSSAADKVSVVVTEAVTETTSK